MGGTFTDCLAQDPAGSLHRAKVLSSGALRGRIIEATSPSAVRVEQRWPSARGALRGMAFRLLGRHASGETEPGSPARSADAVVASFEPDSSLLRLRGPLAGPPGAGPAWSGGAPFEILAEESAPLLAMRLVMGCAPDEPLPPLLLRLGTTQGTNALLQGRGAPTALFVTRGFKDLLRIGTQQRPLLFSLAINKPPTLTSAVVEVDERVDASGEVLQPLMAEPVRAAAERLVSQGITCAAVALVNSFRNQIHEQQAVSLLRGAGFEHVSASAEISPLINFLTRTETAVVNATLTPVLSRFLGRLQRAVGEHARVGGEPLLVMNSAGGLHCPGRTFLAKDSLLSGPAGGVVGAADAGRRAHYPRVITFDMGGTSTDVARYDGEYDYCFVQRVGYARLAAPALAIETVAAGGGSVCRCGGGTLRVGPRSAGADPGPACYGAGGPLTLTDVNLLLGRLDPALMGLVVDRPSAEAALDQELAAFEEQTGRCARRVELLEGFLEIANARMADAIRKVSIRRGYDPRKHALVAFGGAGPQHACAVAEHLGMETILVPVDAGLLSAKGISRALVERIMERQVLAPLESVEEMIPCWMEELSSQARRAVEQAGVPAEGVEIRRAIANLRFVGQDASLQVDYEPSRSLARSFEKRHQQLYGHCPTHGRIEVESLRAIASSRPETDAEKSSTVFSAHRPVAQRKMETRLAGAWQRIPCYERRRLSAGAVLDAPSLVLDRHHTVLVEPGWQAKIGAGGELLLRAPGRTSATAGRDTAHHHEAVKLELFTGRLAGIAGEMGEVLQRTALSTNIKERRDFSCAILDHAGRLAVNAPHVPVHLGSMGLCVRRLCEALPLGPGDVAVTNHPSCGGSHLPDVTVVTPVHLGERLLGFMASRAHHAEIGGLCPGSMPPAAQCLAEEGVVIPPTYLARRGAVCWTEVEHLLSSGPHPSRDPQHNLADLGAALAANRFGAIALQDLARQAGLDSMRRRMKALEARAEQHVRRALRRVPDGQYQGRGALDDGTPLCVDLHISGDHAVMDFAGTGGVHPGNLNATPAVVLGVVIYVLRLLVDRPLHLNEGLMRAVDLRIPRGLLNPRFPMDPLQAPAVVGGNVETSQRLTDILLRALGLAACSQGTMNNVLFGNERFGYYETVGGGSGAGPDFDGADAVHTHMTNTRITDAEVLEHRYPVRVERFAVRAGSGGGGKHRGGDGIVRELSFLAPLSLSIVSQRRRRGPCGLEGGGAGKPGAQQIVRASGEVVALKAIDGEEVGPGDRFILKTPGGGGWGINN